MTLLAQNQNQYGIHKFKIEATKIFGQLCHKWLGTEREAQKYLLNIYVNLPTDKIRITVNCIC